MTYVVEAWWHEYVVSEYETFEEGMAEARRLALARNDCTPRVTGPDVFATVSKVLREEDE